MNRPITIPTATPEAPEWVQMSKAAVWMWGNSLSWRADAAGATNPDYRRFLIRAAQQAFNTRKQPVERGEQ